MIFGIEITDARDPGSERPIPHPTIEGVRVLKLSRIRCGLVLSSALLETIPQVLHVVSLFHQKLKTSLRIIIRLGSHALILNEIYRAFMLLYRFLYYSLIISGMVKCKQGHPKEQMAMSLG